MGCSGCFKDSLLHAYGAPRCQHPSIMDASAVLLGTSAPVPLSLGSNICLHLPTLGFILWNIPTRFLPQIPPQTIPNPGVLDPASLPLAWPQFKARCAAPPVFTLRELCFALIKPFNTLITLLARAVLMGSGAG